MESRGRQNCGFNTGRSHKFRPTQGKQHTGLCWQATVPSWEKNYCSLVGSISWKKVMETKKIMYLYPKILEWNDSAGKEAFRNAKNRFRSETNGISSDIPLPDPNIYIDNVDWNSDIDPDLLLDLERGTFVSVNKGEQHCVILDALIPASTSFSNDGWGWGDAEDDPKDAAVAVVAADSIQLHENHAQGRIRNDNYLNDYAGFGTRRFCNKIYGYSQSRKERRDRVM